MAFCLEHLAGTAIVLLFTVSLCDAKIVRYRFTEKKSVGTNHTTLHSISDIQCVRKCNKERQNGRCTLAGYDKRTKTCYLSDDDPQNVVDTEDEMTGVFYGPDVNDVICAADEPLLNGVPDSYFTASSEGRPAHYARMVEPYTNYWNPSGAERSANPQRAYLQVQFHASSKVVAVATRGGNAGGWTTLYRLAYSGDCGVFHDLVDVAGNNITFNGNTDSVTVVTNQLPNPVLAGCLRLYVLGANNDFPDLNMEVYGCPAV